MRSLALAVLLVGCADPNAQAREDVQRLIPPPERVAVRHEEATAPVRVEAPPPKKALTCEDTRAARVKEAKEALTEWRAHVQEIKPLVKWAWSHKCKLRDTTGSFLVRRTREAGGVRVEVKHGGPDEVACDTPNIKEGVDATLLRELAMLESTSEDAVMFETLAECDAKEKPSLRVTYGDEKSQMAILALP